MIYSVLQNSQSSNISFSTPQIFELLEKVLKSKQRHIAHQREQYWIPLLQTYYSPPHSPTWQHPLRSHRHRSKGNPTTPHLLRQAMPILLLVPHHQLDHLRSTQAPKITTTYQFSLCSISSTLIRCNTRGGFYYVANTPLKCYLVICYLPELFISRI